MKKVWTHKKWVVFGICIFILTVMIKSVLKNDILKMDIVGYNFISTHFIDDKITPIIKVITNIGGAVGVIISLVLVGYFTDNKKLIKYFLINLCIVIALNFVIKNVIDRPRPVDNRLVSASGFSFPSAHSMTAVAYYGFYVFLINRSNKSKKVKILAITLIALLIAMIGISRIYLGVHYTSDVLAGFSCGIAYIIVYTAIVDDFMEDENLINKRKEIKV